MQPRHSWLALALLTLLTGIALLATTPARAAGPTVQVGPGGATCTIQDAVDDTGGVTINTKVVSSCRRRTSTWLFQGGIHVQFLAVP